MESESEYKLILDHSKFPSNKGILHTATHQSQGHHENCGDIIRVFLEIEDSIINDISFDGNGCAICIASASLMTKHLKKLTTEEALSVYNEFHDLITVDLSNKRLGELQVFAEVKSYQMRAKCTELPWITFKAALDENLTISV